MIPGESIVGDDLAYLRSIAGQARAVNVEVGIFGIIGDVNSKDDPVIHKVLTTPGEVIFSNVLVKDARPYWYGMGEDFPADGVNAAGAWHTGKKDAKGNEIPQPTRATPAIRSRCGPWQTWTRTGQGRRRKCRRIIYGGRDSDTWVPVQQSFDWAHRHYRLWGLAGKRDHRSHPGRPGRGGRSTL